MATESYVVPVKIKQYLYDLIDKIDTIGVDKNTWITINNKDHPVRISVGKQKDQSTGNMVNWATFCVLFPTIQTIPYSIYKQATRVHSSQICYKHEVIFITIIRYASCDSEIRYWDARQPNDCYGYCKTDITGSVMPDCKFTPDIIAKITDLVSAIVHAQTAEFCVCKNTGGINFDDL